MKKLVLGSIAMLLLAISVTLFQISCTKEAHAQNNSNSNYTLPPATATTLGGIMVGTGLNITSNGTLSVSQTGSNALSPATTTTLGGVIVDGTTIKVDATGKISAVSSGANAASLIVYCPSNTDEIWEANIDGTNQHKISISLPSGYELNVSDDGGQIHLTADRQKIIFKARNTGTSSDAIFSCSIDGSNVTKLIDNIGTSFDAN